MTHTTCKRNTPDGECGGLVVPGTEYCRSHTTSIANTTAERTQYQFDCADTEDRIEHFKQHSELFSLKSEIAMNQVMLERLMKPHHPRREDDDDILTDVGLATKVVEITKNLAALKKQALKMEVETKELFPKGEVIRILNLAVSVVSEVLGQNDIEGHEELTMQICHRLTELVYPKK